MSETITKTIFIEDLKPKDEVNDVFIVKYIAEMTARDGKTYLNIILADKSGDIESRIWSNAQDVFSKIAKNDFVNASGKINSYQGKRQFVVAQIAKIDSELVSQDDFVSKASEDPEKMFKDLLEIVNGLDDVYIKDLLRAILGDDEIARRIKTWQAGKTVHHAYKSGLLEHILSCATLSVSLSQHYKVNKNFVVAGAILHDLCKIYELTDGINVEYTEEGKLIGHLVKGLEVVDRFSYRIKNFPYNTKTHLKHILLSHHGEYEYGSPKTPMTSEAFLVHQIDLMDSRMGAVEAIKKTDNQAGHWSSFNRHLERIVFKGDLPFYSEYVEASDQVKSNRTPTINKESKAKENKPKEKELKQNLGKMLEDFKVSK